MNEAYDLHTKEFRDGVLRLTLNRPAVRNALNERLIAALTAEFRAIDQSAVRAVVITGSGEKAFCAGADLNPSSKTFGFDYARPTTAYADMLRVAYSLPVPIVGRINGHCMAGGMGLLAVCDMAVAADHAQFGLPEVRIGMFPMQVAALLQSIMPARALAEMCMTGDPISASEALRFGLVNVVAPPGELDACVDGLVQRVAARSPTAIRRGKHALRAISGMTFEQALSYMEAQIGTLPLTADAAEGLAAFAEKRSPQWPAK